MVQSALNLPQHKTQTMWFQWIYREQVGNRSFYQRLAYIKEQFYDRVASAEYWNYFVRDKDLHMLCEMRDLSGCVMAFVAVKVVNEAEWFLELVCSREDAIPGKGRAVLKELERNALDSGVKKLSLMSIPSAITFYHHLGFEFIDPKHQEGWRLIQELQRYHLRVHEEILEKRSVYVLLQKLAALPGWGTGCAKDGLVMCKCL